MKRLPSLIAMLALVAMLDSREAQAQARGPSAQQVQETGQVILGPTAELAQTRQQEEQLDDTARAARFAVLQAWLARLPGRFRIDGQVERNGRSGKASGIADCAPVGAGAGVQCILNATWPFFENMPPMVMITPPAEALNTMRPAMLVLGLSQHPLGIRSMLVPADSIVHSWVGTLDGNTLNSDYEASKPGYVAQRPGESEMTDAVDCADRCMRWFYITAKPASDIVTFVFQSRAVDKGGVKITFIMHRDPAAQAKKPLKSLKAR